MEHALHDAIKRELTDKLKQSKDLLVDEHFQYYRDSKVPYDIPVVTFDLAGSRRITAYWISNKLGPWEVYKAERRFAHWNDRRTHDTPQAGYLYTPEGMVRLGGTP